MTNNERKIFEIMGVKINNHEDSKEILKECSFVDRCSYQTALEMAEWKEQDMIEKALFWLEKNWCSYTYPSSLMFDDFRKAMKEE